LTHSPQTEKSILHTISDHWLKAALRVPSPNCDERPADAGISLLVIHNISLPPGEFGGPHIDALFCNALDGSAHPYFAGICTLQVSAHLLIRRDGSVVQYVPFDKRAWHAGKSSFLGREGCNDFSIGIELEGCDEQPFTAAQYAQLSQITATLLQHYPGLDRERITGHSDIAPGRKTDPGPCFDWQRYHAALLQLQSGSQA
jgi:N-acetyl-anhydromuramoyl-L-alanine amidase